MKIDSIFYFPFYNSYITKICEHHVNRINNQLLVTTESVV